MSDTDILIEALEYYAASDNWKRKRDGKNQFGNHRYIKASVLFDHGSHANFALELWRHVQEKRAVDQGGAT